MINQNLLLTGDDGYNLTNSLRFRSSASAYLNRTPASAGNRRTWTWSGWVKRGAIADGVLFSTGTSGSSYMNLRLQDNGGVQEFSIVSENPSTEITLRTSQQFRDPSAWYHFVFALDTTQATSSNRAKLYVNGVQVTAFSSATYPSLSADLLINNNQAHNIGRRASGSDAYFDGYLTEINFIDGQALTPSSFGETDAQTGVWIPKKYSGTYGTNGFYLPFTDNSALTTSSNAGLGKDFSGNSNYWTTNNISITSGSTYDSMTDVPTLTSATASNYCVLNPITGSATLSNGNLAYTSSSGNYYATIGTIGVSSGKWYWEFTANGAGQDVGICGINNRGQQGVYVGSTADSYGYYGGSGAKYNNGSSSTYGATYTTNDIIGVALDMDAGTIVFYKNNSSQGTAFSSLSGTFFPMASNDNSNAGNGIFNFGQRPFAYTPPTGYVALNTFNLPTPTIGATASTQANKYFNIALYTADTAGGKTISGVGFQPDFVWIKNRDNAEEHYLQDVVRGFGGSGTTKMLKSNSTAAEASVGADVTFAPTSDGFTITDSNYNSGELYYNGRTYASWNWKANGSGSSNTSGSITSTVSANTSAGFSIVTATAPSAGSQGTVGHGLGVTPSMIIVKSRANAYNWSVYHASVCDTTSKYLRLNDTSALLTYSTVWGAALPTSSVFGITGDGAAYPSGTFVAYCFASISGYSAFGKYTGNGSSDGPFVYLGFRPRFVMIKRSDASSDWTILDTARDTYNGMFKILYPNYSSAEDASSVRLDSVSNGFKIRIDSASNNYNTSSGTYIYMAFAENPFKYSLAR